MERGFAKELKNLYHTRNKGIPTIVDVFKDPNELLENRPCAFDEVEKYIDSDGILDEYDPENVDEE